MKNFLASKYFLLFIFGILLVIRGIKAEVEKAPPKTLQIGNPVEPALLMIGIKHRVPEEECTRKSKNGDQLKMHYRYS